MAKKTSKKRAAAVAAADAPQPTEVEESVPAKRLKTNAADTGYGNYCTSCAFFSPVFHKKKRRKATGIGEAISNEGLLPNGTADIANLRRTCRFTNGVFEFGRIQQITQCIV